MQNFTTTKNLITAVVPLKCIIPWLYFHHFLSLLWETLNFELLFINKFIIFLKIVVKNGATVKLINARFRGPGTRTAGPQKFRTGRGRLLSVNFNISNLKLINDKMNLCLSRFKPFTRGEKSRSDSGAFITTLSNAIENNFRGTGWISLRRVVKDLIILARPSKTTIALWLK